LNRDMCKFESSQKDESRWQSTDSSKAYRNTTAFKCHENIMSLCALLSSLHVSGHAIKQYKNILTETFYQGFFLSIV